MSFYDSINIPKSDKDTLWNIMRIPLCLAQEELP